MSVPALWAREQLPGDGGEGGHDVEVEGRGGAAVRVGHLPERPPHVLAQVRAAMGDAAALGGERGSLVAREQGPAQRTVVDLAGHVAKRDVAMRGALRAVACALVELHDHVAAPRSGSSTLATALSWT
eukprot:6990845-Lingulodinium_polyedra.AAC.1